MAALALYQTTIGKKVIMAVTGLILVLFVIAHMIGNLHTFEGPAELNAYGAFLRTIGYPALSNEVALWIVRLVLLSSAILHIWAAVSLTQTDLAGRPIGYRSKRTINASLAARTMRYSGVLLALFIIYHLLHFTTGTLLPGFRHADIYANVTSAFRNPVVSLIYIVAMALLGMHLYHGVWSMFQTLGLNNRGRNRFWGGVATVLSLVVALGFVSVPLSVLAGLVR
jgi:succinate dehydrogenase / fumarate reductase, cytochrome b subunit